jgi:hypothetical protein
VLYVAHWVGLDGSERRDSWWDARIADEVVAGLAERGREVLAFYGWTGPVEAGCTRCGQALKLSSGEWRNPFGFSTCPKVHVYPYRHDPRGVPVMPDLGCFPDWWEEPELSRGRRWRIMLQAPGDQAREWVRWVNGEPELPATGRAAEQRVREVLSRHPDCVVWAEPTREPKPGSFEETYAQWLTGHSRAEP